MFLAAFGLRHFGYPILFRVSRFALLKNQAISVAALSNHRARGLGFGTGGMVGEALTPIAFTIRAGDKRNDVARPRS